MRSCPCLVGLLWHLSVRLLCTAREVRFHPKQEALLPSLSSYEVVFPARVNEWGETFPASQHYRRRKRSPEEPPQPRRAHYRLSAYGQRFQLSLSADARFIASSYAVLHLGAAGERPRPELQHCFYSGHVNARPAHTAVLSLCGGLMGTFKAHDGEYFVEPLMNTDGGDHDDEHYKPHLVYRHEINETAPPRKSHKPCPTSEKWSMKKIVLSLKNSSSINEDLGALHNAVLQQHPSKKQSFDEKNSYMHSRRKRFLSYPRYVEVMVTADAKMVHHYGQNLEHYVLTLMSIVAAIYKDPSIGNLINIMIVKLIAVHNEQEGPSISFNAAATLQNFCVWQQMQNILDDTHPFHHDTAVLITREDICRVQDKCDTLGLAELGTMCDPYRSCSISEENGLSTAYTIAHELGHVFNMPHDDSFKCKEAGFKHQFHVMAPTLFYNTNPWTWSKCSQKYITEFLDTGYGECLLDKPSGSAYKLAFQLPGVLYDVNKQCELMFGLGSQVCPYLKQCKRLWCTSTDGIRKGCRTQHMPLADGTECGSSMHCHHGVCVKKEMELRPIDGEWSQWGPYGACTRTCGGGIKSTSRDCNQPEPKNGGKYCVGRRMKFRSCNTEPCPKGRKDFRDEQCSNFDGKHFNLNGLPDNVHWLPKYSGILMKDRCKLFCRVAGTTSYYQLKDRVTDGTPCGLETNDLCVQGLCRQAGCDHVLNSKARRDKCGVCGGDNSSCKTLSGTFNSAQYGYNPVVKIPAGATNIDIRQHSYSGRPEDDNYLALVDSKGNFVLNGNFVVSMFKREIDVHGTIFEYSGSDNSVERINCTDRLEEDLVLQVLCVGNLHSPDVRYSFSIPIESRSDQFSWNPNGPRQHCSKMCQGVRRQKVICMRESDQLVVSDQRCEHLPRPSAQTEHCNTQCELRWHVIGKSECSSQCGQGYRTSDIRCMKYSSLKRLSEPVDDKYCGDKPKPPRRESCHGNCLITSWQYSAWSQCSRSCGGGTKSREAYCMNNFGHHLADGECNEHQKVVIESCSELSCPEWTTSEWSECRVTCGKGTRHRQVTCQLNKSKLGDNFCDSNTKPESVSSCELQECASWQVGPWGSCAVTCGHGYQIRAVSCVIGPYRTIMDDKECNAASRPKDSQDCELPSCSEAAAVISTSVPIIQKGKLTQWRYGSWTACSVSCGKGNHARYVSCRDARGAAADDSFCSHLPRPADIANCFIGCGEWQVGEWSPCPVSCGNGRVTRQVFCINYRQQLDESSCDPEGRPSEEQDCKMPSCPRTLHQVPRKHVDSVYIPQPENPPVHKRYNPPNNGDQWHLPRVRGSHWRTGPWGSCSSTCAGGFQRRAVVCQGEEGKHVNYCDEAAKPFESRHCDSGPCPHWNYGSWRECSVTCGKGVKYRDVYCINKDQGQLEEENCKHLPKSQTHRVCRAERCPSWKTSKWTECSVTCGMGFQQRNVFCRLRGQGRVHEEMCNVAIRPDDKEYCWMPDCLQYQWLADDWQDCSVACGQGESRRKVKCVDSNKMHVNESYCDPATKPSPTKQCKNVPCRYIVFTGDSSKCLGDCEPRYYHKVTYCKELKSTKKRYSNGLRTISYRKCPVMSPPYIQKCTERGCIQAATWKVGKWRSKCSATCGVGLVERRVECTTENDVLSDLCLSRLKPEARKTCQAEDCKIFTSCKDIHAKKGIRKDGEYQIKIRGKALKVFCSGMQSSNPKEYITLPKGETENFSEVFGYRLRNPYECPFNGSRQLDCECRNDYLAAGYTVFSKIRLDIITMQIKSTDLLFAQTAFGKAVPFATAGDCYSAARCPQGQFSINLAGTGLRISSAARWIAQGNYATINIRRSQDGTKIYGRCGGYCGKCVPHIGVGLQVHFQ
uniref:A disintegrin and metalloproteinase with thrombospondin motifs 20 isoform X1 n=1 Tax=Geotrypetes seraphini TaxID=260995 RepID=A0A6P8SJT6_GEOSA|nr:A disintegrin and metalloproteinase with thrombospondin motifs 20 isoform X1 [Geotrypetes seraphini]